MPYQSAVGRDSGPWIHHFQEQARGSLKPNVKDGLIVVSKAIDSAKEKHAIPIQTIAPIEQGISQASAQIREKRAINRRTNARKNQSCKRRRKGKVSKKKTKKTVSPDIFHKHGRTNNSK